MGAPNPPRKRAAARNFASSPRRLRSFFFFASKGRNGFALFRGFLREPDTLDGISVPDPRLERFHIPKEKHSPPPSLGHTEFGQKRVVDGRREIDHRLAEPDDVVPRALRRRRARPPSCCRGRRASVHGPETRHGTAFPPDAARGRGERRRVPGIPSCCCCRRRRSRCRRGCCSPRRARPASVSRAPARQGLRHRRSHRRRKRKKKKKRGKPGLRFS